MFLGKFQSYQWGTLKLYRSKGFKITNCQSLRSQKESQLWPLQPKCVQAHTYGLSLLSIGFKSTSKFNGLQLCSPLTYRPYIICMERSKSSKNIPVPQGACSISAIGFSLSKWPHFHSVYLLAICKRMFMTVCNNM